MSEHPAFVNNCFVCGPHNPVGLHIAFRLQNDRCVAEYTPGRNLAGWNNLVHGGILYSMLDDVMANWLFLRGERALTSRCTVRYRAMLPIDTPVRLEGWEARRRARYVQMCGTISRMDRDIRVAEAEAGFMVSCRT